MVDVVEGDSATEDAAAKAAADKVARDRADREVAKAAAKQKADLEDGADAVVPVGDEDAPVGRSFGADARKAIYKSAKTVRTNEVAQNLQDHPEVAEAHEQFTAAQRAGATESSPLPEGAAPEGELPEGEQVVSSEEDSRTSVSEPEGEREVIDPREPVTVTINGVPRDVPRMDIDAAGGISAYQSIVAAEEAYAAAYAAQTETQQALDEVKAIKAELAKPRDRKSQPTERGQRRSTTDSDRGETSGLEDLSKRDLMRRISSGDPKVQQPALDEYIRRGIAEGRQDAGLEPEESSRTATATESHGASAPGRSGAQDEARGPVIVGGRVLTPTQCTGIDQMFVHDYQELATNPETFKKVRLMWNNLMADPGNAHRRPIDLSRQAAEYIKSQSTGGTKDVLAARQAEKRSLQRRSTAAPGGEPPGAGPARANPSLTKESSYVAKMRERRGMRPEPPMTK